MDLGFSSLQRETLLHITRELLKGMAIRYRILDEILYNQKESLTPHLLGQYDINGEAMMGRVIGILVGMNKLDCH